MLGTCDKVSERPHEKYNLQSLYFTGGTLEGGMAVQWLALLPRDKKLLGFGCAGLSFWSLRVLSLPV